MPSGLILGIESSCDETSAAVVRDGHEVLSNVVASQLVHSNYGGVVPELASREHLRAILPVVREAMERAGKTYADLDAIAVTEGPGLAGALLVGITFAKSLAFGLDLPLIAVNHLEGHIHAVLMEQAEAFASASPLLALVVSGGHTHLYLATREGDTWRYRNIGKTLDDAAGEAYDKAAKLLGLPYPGGPWMDALAAHGNPKAVPFSFAQIKTKATGNTAPKLARELAYAARTVEVPNRLTTLEVAGASTASGASDAGAPHLASEMWVGSIPDQATTADSSLNPPLKGTGFSPSITGMPQQGALAPEAEPIQRFDLSFSGIKTAVRRYVEIHQMHERVAEREQHLRENNLLTAKPSNAETLVQALTFFDQETLDLIASFQASVTSYLTRTLFAAAEHYGAQGLLVSGGVAANRELRERMTTEAYRRKLPIAFPQISLSTDNAAMIAASAWQKFLHQQFADSALEAVPQLRLG